MDDQPLTARERLECIQQAEECEALARHGGWLSRWILLRIAAIWRWLAKDRRDYEEMPW